ncbi:MAG: type IV secretion system protein [Synergistaceae bacterium]|nr:type IV secretion system protein [Synergistaceae bacterium]
MSFFSKKGNIKPKAGTDILSDERARQEAAEKSLWISSKKRHIDVYQELAFSVAQWRLATFAMLILLILSVLSNMSLVRNVKIQPYVIQVDQHGYAIPVKAIDASDIDSRVVAAQIGTFIINSRARMRDVATQLVFSEKSFKAVARDSNASRLLNSYYRESPPPAARYPVSVKILSVQPMSNSVYQASWTETILAGDGQDQEFGYIGTFSVVVSPPGDYARLIDNPLGIYITDFNIIRSY